MGFTAPQHYVGYMAPTGGEMFPDSHLTGYMAPTGGEMFPDSHLTQTEVKRKSERIEYGMNPDTQHMTGYQSYRYPDYSRPF